MNNKQNDNREFRSLNQLIATLQDLAEISGDNEIVYYDQRLGLINEFGVWLALDLTQIAATNEQAEDMDQDGPLIIRTNW